MATKAKKATAPAAKTGPQPRADINGWVLCPGDNVLIVSPGEEYHGLFGKVDTFPTILELSSYVQIDGRPSTVGRVLVPNAHLRWMGPGLEQVDQLRPTRPGQRVRVVLDNESLATPEMKALDGQLGEATELGPLYGENLSMITVKFDDPALLPAAINSFDLIIVPTPVVQYVPEPEAEHPAIQEESDLPFLNEAQAAAPVYTPTKMKLVPLADIIVTSNTRKVFDETALGELAESIKAQGVIAPITVRPHGTEADKFELVAGERRYRASKLAEQQTIPAVIRTLTDREFLEIQLLENLQRVDVRPADEAQAFSKLLGSHLSTEEIAQRVGKPVKFVHQRAKLVSLIPFWFELLEAEKLALVAAHELARLPAHSQLEVKHVVDKQPGYYEKGYSKTDIRNIINEKVLRKLDKAPWDKADAWLVPSAGPCTLCPKRSRAQGVLFETKEGVDLCLDASCFTAKRIALVSRRLAEVTAELGKAPVCVSSEYSPSKELVEAGVISYQHFGWSTEGNATATQVFVMDGSEAGQLKYAHFYNSKSAAASSPEAIAAEKREQAERIRKQRTDKMHRTIIGEKLTLDVQADPLGTEALAVLRWLITEQLRGQSKSKLAFVVDECGWDQPTEAQMDNWKVKEANGKTPYANWLSHQLETEADVMDTLGIYLALEARHKMDNEWESRQFSMAELVGEAYEPLKQQATEFVEARYYSKKGKQLEVAA